MSIFVAQREPSERESELLAGVTEYFQAEKKNWNHLERWMIHGGLEKDHLLRAFGPNQQAGLIVHQVFNFLVSNHAVYRGRYYEHLKIYKKKYSDAFLRPKNLIILVDNKVRVGLNQLIFYRWVFQSGLLKDIAESPYQFAPFWANDFVLTKQKPGEVPGFIIDRWEGKRTNPVCCWMEQHENNKLFLIFNDSSTGTINITNDESDSIYLKVPTLNKDYVVRYERSLANLKWVCSPSAENPAQT